MVLGSAQVCGEDVRPAGGPEDQVNRKNIAGQRQARWTITGKDSNREGSYYMVCPTARPGSPPGWFPESLAKAWSWNFDDWKSAPDKTPPGGG